MEIKSVIFAFNMDGAPSLDDFGKPFFFFYHSC